MISYIDKTTMSRGSYNGTWWLLFSILHCLRVYKCNVIQTSDTVAVSHVKRRDGRGGTITILREVCPNTLVHRVERLRAVHECEGWDIGQVDLDQFSVHFLQLGRVGLSGDRR